MNRFTKSLFSLLFTIIIIYIAIPYIETGINNLMSYIKNEPVINTVDEVPPYDNKACITINNNEPFFTEEELSKTENFQNYSNLDYLGRCGRAEALLNYNNIATTARGKISHVKPTGWMQKSYKGVIPDDYLYNRCHLLAYKLTGQNDNEKNLITCTRYMNVEGMLQYESKVMNYIYRNKNNNILYRVTPDFKDKELLSRGVLMEAYSKEDNGALKFNVYCYNVQPKIEINYKDGSNYLK